jgi:hypothetical protein
MYMVDFDLLELEMQLHGFDAALDANDLLRDHDRFNSAFREYLWYKHNLSCSTGWASALLRKFGQGEETFRQFIALVADATSSHSNTQAP